MEKIKNKEIYKFLIVGSSSVLLDFIIYRILVSSGLDVSSSKLLSFVSGSVFGFILNKYWTFNSKKKAFKEIIYYIVLYTITAYLNIEVNKFVLGLYTNTLFSFLCATGVSTVINFLGQKFIVFKKNT